MISLFQVDRICGRTQGREIYVVECSMFWTIPFLMGFPNVDFDSFLGSFGVKSSISFQRPQVLVHFWTALGRSVLRVVESGAKEFGVFV